MEIPSLIVRLLFLLSLAAVPTMQAQFAEVVGGKLRQLHVITRHGSRMPLSKKSANLDEHPEGPQLTATGEKQLYDLGVWIRNRYHDLGEELFTKYNPNQFHLESSALDRTMASANALALGLLNDEARDPFHENMLPGTTTRPNVPVYSVSPQNDVYIRAYDKCDAFHDNLDRLYESREWQDLEESHSSLLSKLGGDARFSEYAVNGKIPLEDVWNVFDLIMVAKTECPVFLGAVNETSACMELPDRSVRDALGEDQWRDLQNVAHRAELLKYSRETARDFVGGNLVTKIGKRMLMTHSEPQFFLYSAHYPTLLGFMAALEEEPFEKEVIPGYGAALIVEVFEIPGGGDYYHVRIHYKPADSEQERTLDKSCLTMTSPDCPLFRKFQQFAQGRRVEEWCGDCNNDSADVCLRSIVSASCSEDNLDRPALAGALSGLVVGALLALFSTWFCARRRRNARATENISKSPPPEDATSTSASFA